jgi:hypothetical protein
MTASAACSTDAQAVSGVSRCDANRARRRYSSVLTRDSLAILLRVSGPDEPTATAVTTRAISRSI